VAANLYLEQRNPTPPRKVTTRRVWVEEERSGGRDIGRVIRPWLHTSQMSPLRYTHEISIPHGHMH
jgi:hypothetical protein